MKNFPHGCHVLNGDALAERFPNSLDGKRLVFRECLIEGPVSSLEEEHLFFDRRAKYISDIHPECSIEDYYSLTVTELRELHSLPPNVPIYFWFEDDLFCQANLWFLFAYVDTHKMNHPLYWVRPNEHTPWGFGGLSDAQLVEAFQNRQQIANPEIYVKLWHAYQQNDFSSLQQLASSTDHVEASVQAHIDRFPEDNSLGRPQRTIISIIQELNTLDFGTIFQEFCTRESIYGFGDLQFKRLLDQMEANGQLPSLEN